MTDRKKALVTGGATGIGRSAVLALARAGYDVAINYASSAKAAEATAKEAQALGARTLLLQCDVSDDAAVRRMMVAVGEAFGHLDALVNNAGTTADLEGQGPREPGHGGVGPHLRGQCARHVPGDPCGRAAAAQGHSTGASSTPRASSVCAPARSRCPMRRARRPWSISPRRWPGTSAPRSASMPWRRAGWKASGWNACSATSTTT